MDEDLSKLRSILQIFLEAEVSLYPFDQPPPALVSLLPSTWASLQNPKFTMKDRIKLIWRPAMDTGGEMSQIISEGCIELLLLHAPKSAFPVSVCYLYRLGSDLCCLLGNPPATQEDINRCTTAWSHFPDSYALFTKVHNGLSWNGNNAIGPLPLNKMNLIAHHPDYKIDWGEVNPKIYSLLLFSGDGFGNIQCYDLEQPLNGDYVTVLWDHEVRDVYDSQKFWDYLEEFLRHIFSR